MEKFRWLNKMWSMMSVRICIMILAVIGITHVFMPKFTSLWEMRPDAVVERKAKDLEKSAKEKIKRIMGKARSLSDEVKAKRKVIRERRERMEARAKEICELYPAEPVCVSWSEWQKCLKDEKCLKTIGDNDYWPYADTSDVIACFPSSNDDFNESLIYGLPSFCKILDLSVIPNEDKFKKIELSGNELAWAKKIKPDHLAGIARGIKLIITKDEELNKEFLNLVPILESLEAMGSGSEKEMATGILVGLYNSATVGLATSKEKYIQDTRAFCASLKDKDIVPVRCRVMENGDDAEDTDDADASAD